MAGENDLYTFVDSTGSFQFTIKREFLVRNPHPEQEHYYNLIAKQKMNDYLHNPSGPAIIELKNNKYTFYLNGREASKEMQQKLLHDFNYNDLFMDTLGISDE